MSAAALAALVIVGVAVIAYCLYDPQPPPGPVPSEMGMGSHFRGLGTARGAWSTSSSGEPAGDLLLRVPERIWYAVVKEC